MTQYGTLISEVNKEKRRTWCLDRIAEGELELSDVIRTDESSFQLQPHQKITYKNGYSPPSNMNFWLMLGSSS